MSSRPSAWTLNGNGITVSNDIWEQMKQNDDRDFGFVSKPRASDSMPIASSRSSKRRRSLGDPLRMGMVFPVSTHNYELQVLACRFGHQSRVLHEERTRLEPRTRMCLLSVTPPPQMPATLDQGTIQGYCVGEPWNQQAVFKRHRRSGRHESTRSGRTTPRRSSASREEWAEKHPNTDDRNHEGADSSGQVVGRQHRRIERRRSRFSRRASTSARTRKSLRPA